MKRPLTRNDKETLENILINKFEDDLEINKHKLNLEIFLTEQFTAFIDKTFGKELLENFKKCRKNIRTSNTPSLLSDNLLSIDEDYKKELKSELYDDIYKIGNLLEDSPDLKFNYVSIVFPKESFSLSIDTCYPNLYSLDPEHKIFYKTSRNPIEIKDFINSEKLEELLILFKEYYTRKFILSNLFRLYRYSGHNSSIYNYGEFLWNIKTWEELETLNKEWYDILNEYIKVQDQSKKDINLSNITLEEIFDGLDDELGL